jgi:hypothetical protein
MSIMLSYIGNSNKEKNNIIKYVLYNKINNTYNIIITMLIILTNL